MPSDTIPFPKENGPATRDIGLSDAQIAEKIHHADPTQFRMKRRL